MLDQRPREPEWLSWLAAGTWAALILATIPLARIIADLVAETAGDRAFLWLTAVVVAAGLLAALRLTLGRALPAGALASLLVFGGALLWLTWRLRDIPVEAFHVVQYGVLSLLVYRALLHRCTDASVFALSALVTGIVGILDEWLQWLIPARYWGLGDVALNFLVAVLTQAALATGLRPGIVVGWPSGRSIRRLAFVLAAGLLMLCASYANTPDRVAWYASRLPGLGFLLDGQSMMVEYGHRYTDPEIGVFRSRFSPAELRRLDLERGAEVARIMSGFREDGEWHDFRKVYTVPRDPYVHEFGTHLFRRNRHLSLAREDDRLARQRADSYLIAARENLIMEKYFPRAIGLSSHRWGSEVRGEVERHAPASEEYESAVSRQLVTRMARRQVMAGFLFAIGVLLVLGIIAGRFRPRAEDIREGDLSR